jgi:2-keto-4-pentenoate hydratase
VAQPARPDAEQPRYAAGRLEALRAGRDRARPTYLTDRGRLIHGRTPPGGSVPSPRTRDLDPGEVAEVVALIVAGRQHRRPVTMPERLRARSWASVEQVLADLETALGWHAVGWKVGAASREVRRAENIPSPSPGRIFEHAIFSSPAVIGPEYFVNYRLCECEFAFELGTGFPAREKPYTESDIRAGIESLMPVIEIGDSVFEDWYSLSGYFGGMYDNAGGAALVEGARTRDWHSIDLPAANIDLYVNDSYVKSGQGAEAMGNPVASLAWMVNWVRERGRAVEEGEVISTGTCTAHCFVAPGDRVSADFGSLGLVEAHFAGGLAAPAR